MASLLEAQADTGACSPAWAPSRRPTLAAVALAISIGIGQRADPAGALLLLDVPLPEQGVQAADAGGDGDAEPVAVDRVVVLAARSRRRAQASIAATTPSWAERSSRRASTRSSTSDGSTADRGGDLGRQVVGQVGLGIRRTPDVPASRAAQVLARVPAERGGGAEPVTTTRVRDIGCSFRIGRGGLEAGTGMPGRRAGGGKAGRGFASATRVRGRVSGRRRRGRPRSGGGALDVGDGVAHGLEVLGLLVGDATRRTSPRRRR